MRKLKDQIKDYKQIMFDEDIAAEKRYLWLAMKKAKLHEKNGTSLLEDKHSDTDSMWSD